MFTVQQVRPAGRTIKKAASLGGGLGNSGKRQVGQKLYLALSENVVPASGKIDALP